MRKYIRLPLAGTYNTRELGGYPTDNGGITSHNIFLRSDDLSSLTESDKDFLYEYGIRSILDLRAEEEIKNFDSHIMNDKRFDYKNVSLMDYFDKFDDLYITIATIFSDKVKIAFNYIGERISYGGILFHCMVGKDRTGVTAALLLSLAGVSMPDITTNYMVSSIYLRPLFENYLKVYPDTPLNFMESSPAMIESFMKHIIENHGNVRNYLQAIGVEKSYIDSIADIFVNICL
jgi:Protein tyrosine/serine phosphatase